ncbi:response regulator transcription factor [Mucilaginibacter terrae]|uniref:DNA-binding response OmpR family regulator n=1 Tax=Mucilaginibacter terrae TaxID=1955052 RepID=A0ABU3H0C3_9SPHI|nr:response regulator [Mucilaginibacter terrae]MDT3404692.1 DNA-binding response OmpR family regulator [Mucilaginibacter terrae]
MLKRILVLDDNMDILEVVHEVLTYEQFEVKSTSDSTGIVGVAEEYNPDLIILDFKLMDGNGGDICRTIKSHKQLHKTPVIIFSAYTTNTIDFFSFGCDAVIAKPFDLTDLIGTVNQCLKMN